MKKGILFIITIGFCLAVTIRGAFALSAAAKSQIDYVFMLSTIRDMNIMVDNFGNEEQKKKFEDIRVLFKMSAERHYAQDFVKPLTLNEENQPENNSQSSIELFTQLKIKISLLFDELSNNYISRSQMILDSTSGDVNDILINYGKNSGDAKYFYRAIDPTTEIKPYKSGNYHYYRDKETLERYLRNGYKSLQDARNLSNNSDFIYIKSKQNKSQEDLNYIVKTNLDIIRYCRQAKQYGIEMHRMLKLTNLGSIQRKYNITIGTITRYPIYDDRIPEDYKVDAVDNMKLLFKIERDRTGYDNKKTDTKSSVDSKTETK
jgi:hypothetical protein